MWPRCAGVRLAAADRHDDFQLVAVLQSMRGVLTARHDVAIFFQRNAFAGVAQFFDQCRDAARIRQLARCAVDLNSNHFQFTL